MSKKTAIILFLRRHTVVLVVLCSIMLLWGTTFAVIYSRIEQSISAREASALKMEKETEELIEQLTTEKQAQLAAEKKKKEQEALEAEEQRKKAAEEANSAPAPTQAVNRGEMNCNIASSHNNPASVDVLVNKKHCLKPLSFVPSDLVSAHGATISAKVATDFNRMFDAAAAAGQPFTVSSSYRSYQTQVSTYNYWVSINGQQAADTVSARPGYSEHQTGMAVDVGANGCDLNCFGGTSQYQWFQANAANYGFIQRYYAGYESITGYAGEEWHYRYVGAAVAQDMKAKGIKTLEQYWGMDGGSYRQ